MKRLLCLLPLSLSLSAPAADRLADGFRHPPDQTKPWCYWYWISDNISREGITRDLEAMARVGIGEAFIGNVFLEDVPAGTVKVLSPEWWDLVAHALREGGRTGVNIGMFNCPGWSQSGGPWIRPTETMRRLASAETTVTGPRRFVGRIMPPVEPFQDVALIAFPAPQDDTATSPTPQPRITSDPPAAGLEKLVDGDLNTVAEFPAGAGQGNVPFTVDFKLSAPFTARSLELVPGPTAFGSKVELQAADGAGRFHTVRHFTCDRSNMAPGVGFMPRGPVTVAFPVVTAERFRLVFTGGLAGSPRPALAEIRLRGAARLEAFVEKQLGKMHPTPLPRWDTYLWPTQSEPDTARLVIPTTAVQDLTALQAADGTLVWDVPAGDWILQRIGMTPTGMTNSPASVEGQGLEVDKMNRDLATRHFDAFIGELLRRVPAADRQALTRVVADSYEMGSQNWTDGLETAFARRYGYNPVPWLPVLSGRLAGSADQSERFLWDLRRLVADRVATEYVGGLRDACRRHGLGLWLENYGHWGFPGEFLKYGGASDRVGGEYWVTGDLGSIELRAASSCVNTYGGTFVSAEAFTGGPAFQNAPGALKARGDWSFCEGVNHLVLHVNIHQPWDDKRPGVNTWFGTEFNRHNTWFAHSRAWVDYLRRCCWLLQQGHRVADVAYFIGEDAPKMTGVRQPELPPGRDFDYINAEVIERRLGVKDGQLTLPHGATYRVLVLPPLDTMRPAVLRKLRTLVQRGATVLGPAPSRSPSLEDYPRADAEVRTLAAALWGAEAAAPSGERRVGRGRVIWGRPLESVLASLNSSADFVSAAPLRFTHRRAGKTDIYFVANPGADAVNTTAAFRTGGKAPEFWWPDSGRIERPAVYDVAGGVVSLPLALVPHGSVFVVFRDGAQPPSRRIISVRRAGKELLGTTVGPIAESPAHEAPNHFTFAAWIRPTDSTTLVREATRAIVGMNEKRNEVFPAPHGESFGGAGHVGCGLSVGTNGVLVFEHGANYFAPPLVHAAALKDWTHVAVVYRDGQPSLYLNGLLARTGLKSGHFVHSGAASGPSPQFRGQVGSLTRLPRSLNDAEAAKLAETTPHPLEISTEPPIRIVRSGRALAAFAATAGDYEIHFANGQQRNLQIPEPPPPLHLDGPWEVRFSPGWGAPERITFAKLCDWRYRPETDIRHYSGVATYVTTFAFPAEHHASRSSQVALHLGELRDVATVRLNGRELGTVWLAPARLDATPAIQAGANHLEIEVVNVWNNRLVGDAALPPTQRRTFLSAPTVSAQTPLLPAGLLGPVRLYTSNPVGVPESGAAPPR